MIRTFGKFAIFSGATLLALAGTSGCRKPAPVAKTPTHTVSKGEIEVTVIESGTVDSIKSVEIKSGVTGRLTQALVEEGDRVKKGQLLAVVDPQETRLRVEQDRAQLNGAISAVDRADIEIQQRRVSAAATFEQAKARVAQLEQEVKFQPELTRLTISQAESALQNAIVEKDRLVQSAHPSQRASTLAALQEAKNNLTNAQRDFDRQVDLEAKGFVSTRVLDNSRLTLDVAKARVRSNQEQFDRLEEQLKAELERADQLIRQARVELSRTKANQFAIPNKRQELISARAEVEKARAALKDADALAAGKRQSLATVAQLRSVVGNSERQLKETTVLSPIDGVVIKKYLQLGELATGLSTFSAGTAIYKVEDRSKMRIKLFVNEIDVAKLKVGTPARASVDAFPNQDFKGTVTKVAPASKDAGAASGAGQSADSVVKYEIEITLSDGQAVLRSGMSAKCFIEIAKSTDSIVVPIDFLSKDGRDFFATPAGTKTKKKLKVGIVTGSKVEVLEGLKVGDVIDKPAYKGPKRKGFMQMGPDDDGQEQ